MRIFTFILLGLLIFCCGCNTIYQISLFKHLFGKDEDEVNTIPFTGVWSDGQHLTAPRTAPCAAIETKIFVCGGENDTGAIDTFEVYDTENGTWSPLNSLPVAASGHVCIALDEKLYVFGGTGDSCVYTPLDDAWNTISSPEPRLHGCGASVNGKIYFFGGKLDSGITSASTQIYDTATDSWSEGAIMPGSRAGAFCVEIDDKIYVAGGVTNPDGVGADIYTDTIYEYIPYLDFWSQKNTLTKPRAFGASAVVNARFLLFGGYDGNYPGLTLVESYNPAWDSLQSLTGEPSGRAFTCGAAVGTRVYIIGGKIADDSYTALVREFIAP